MLMLSEKDHKKEYSVRAGDEAEIIVFENSSAGYQWNISTTSGIEILENRYEEGSKSPGSGGHRHWRIRLNEPGKQKVRGLYQRPWEKKTSGTQLAVTFMVT